MRTADIRAIAVIEIYFRTVMVPGPFVFSIAAPRKQGRTRLVDRLRSTATLSSCCTPSSIGLDRSLAVW
jgi:hypothetical protein